MEKMKSFVTISTSKKLWSMLFMAFFILLLWAIPAAILSIILGYKISLSPSKLVWDPVDPWAFFVGQKASFITTPSSWLSSIPTYAGTAFAAVSAVLIFQKPDESLTLEEQAHLTCDLMDAQLKNGPLEFIDLLKRPKEQSYPRLRHLTTVVIVCAIFG